MDAYNPCWTDLPTITIFSLILFILDSSVSISPEIPFECTYGISSALRALNLLCNWKPSDGAGGKRQALCARSHELPSFPFHRWGSTYTLSWGQMLSASLQLQGSGTLEVIVCLKISWEETGPVCLLTHTDMKGTAETKMTSSLSQDKLTKTEAPFPVSR